ncbi:MAG: Clp protease/crotonase-like domain-containing protein [Planctomycetota bacterium]
MKSLTKLMIVIILFVCVSFSVADTFKHKESGEVFTGFATQKVTTGRTLVFNSEESKMTPVVLSDYEITSDRKGRRNTVSLLLLDQPEIFLSQTVSQQAAAVIIETSNKGPQAIIIQIDGPGGRAIVAMACDKIYIKSTAGVGAVGSAKRRSSRDQDYAESLSIYNLDFQLNDYLYATVLAQKQGRPELLVRALIDRSISIVEVANIDGSRAFVEKKDRQATQTLIRTLSEGMSATESDSVSPAEIIGKVLNLTAKEAVELELVDGTADSTADILAEMQLSESKLTPVSGVEKVMKKFTAARRNIAEGLYRIDQYEQDIQTLSDQFSTIDNQLRTGTQTRETSRGDYAYRSNRRREISNEYNNYDQGLNDVVRNEQRRNSRIDSMPRSQTVTTEEPRVNIEIVYAQLTTALLDVEAEYRRLLNLVDRWPGGLPPTVTRAMLQKDMDSASSELDRLYRYQPVYPFQDQSQIPQRRSRNRRRY